MNAMQALGWALLHFVWQGALVAVGLGLGLRVTRGRAATTRYALAVMALFAMLAVPAGTMLRLWRAPGPAPEAAVQIDAGAPGAAAPVDGDADEPAPAPPDAGPDRGPAAAAGEAARGRVLLQAGARLAALAARQASEPLGASLPWLVRLWFAGVVLLSCKLLGAWMQAQRLAHRATRPAPRPLAETLTRLAAGLRVSRPVRLLESAAVQVPAVVGWLRPVVLVPATALTGLSPLQLELLLAHELAHVRRHDYLVNLLQSLVETLLFYHPAVWWVSQRIRQEREHCCDDEALRLYPDARLYAGALLEMERLRAVPPRLAAAASGGGLEQRIRRLFQPAAPHAEPVPRWIPAALGLATVVLIAASAHRTGAAGPDAGLTVVETPADRPRGDKPGAAGQDHATPPVVIRHPDPSQGTLRQRQAWAVDEARRRGLRAYWIGWSIAPPRFAPGLLWAARLERGSIVGPDITISGRLTSFGRFEGYQLPGTALPADLAAPRDIAVLFAFEPGATGRGLVAARAASFELPVDLIERPLVWIGAGDDAASLASVQAWYADGHDAEARADLVMVAGVHGTSAAVVPLLVRWLAPREPLPVRREAAEWLGRHPDPEALAQLARAARRDASPEVRRSAAEAVGEMQLPAAVDTAIVLARTLRDADARREAIEGLGGRDDERARRALVDIARRDHDTDAQREAVESLGDRGDPEAARLLADLAGDLPSHEARREAVETLGRILPPLDVERVLPELLRREPDPGVQRQIVETLGRELEPEPAARLLRELARTAPSTDAQRQAVESLGRLDTTLDPGVFLDVVRSHPDLDVRREAVETLARSKDGEAQVVDLLKDIALGDHEPDVQRAAIESLVDLPGGAGIAAVIDVARSHPDRDVRRTALEALLDSDDPRAQKLFERALEEK